MISVVQGNIVNGLNSQFDHFFVNPLSWNAVSHRTLSETRAFPDDFTRSLESTEGIVGFT